MSDGTNVSAPDDALFADRRVVHDDGVHPNERVASNARAVNHGAVANVRVLFEHDSDTREHVDDATLLHALHPSPITMPPPVGAQRPHPGRCTRRAR